jgi:hypothetical protein
MVAGALLSDSFAVLALAYYIWICLVVGLWSQVFPDFVGIRKAQKAVSQMRDGRVGDRRRGRPRYYHDVIVHISTMPMPVTAAAAAETNHSRPAVLPAGRFRTKSIERMMLNTRDTPKTPRSTPMPISFTSAAPARPRQITSTTDRAFGRSAPALLEAATLPAVQATALDRIFRTKSIERMMLNTRDTPKTPSSTPTRCSC